MIKHIKLEKNRITLTCSLPLDMERFAAANATLTGDDKFHLEDVDVYKRPPMRVEYIKPKTKDGDCRIVLTSPVKDMPLYYEDMKKLVKLIERSGAADDGVLEKFRTDARNSVPGFNTKLYPGTGAPKAEVTATSDGRVEIRLQEDHPNYTEAGGVKLIGKLNQIYGISAGNDNGVYFTTNIYSNDRQRLVRAAATLAEHGVIDTGKEAEFVSETRAGQVKNFALAELADVKRFVDMATPQIDPVTKAERFSDYMQQKIDDMAGYVSVMLSLAKTGDFRAVPPDQLKTLKAVATLDALSSDPESMKAEEWLRKSVQGYEQERGVTGFLRAFAAEIEDALQSQHAGAGQGAVPASRRSARGTGGHAKG